MAKNSLPENVKSFCDDLKHYTGPKRGRKVTKEKAFWLDHPELIKGVLESDAPIKVIYSFARTNELPLPTESTFSSWVSHWRKEAQAEAQAMEEIAPHESNGYIPSAEKVLAPV